ncbi:hypothetical protein SAMN02910456_02622 [Ruminococcaceae bacterium YRB3002]|nr:hypothetical protein SAMN02910456_02622 [Ruminococcaceae bacterium YRB3002]
MYEEQVASQVLRFMVDGVETVFRASSQVLVDCFAKYLAKREQMSREEKEKALINNHPLEAIAQGKISGSTITMNAEDAEKLITSCEGRGIRFDVLADQEDTCILIYNSAYASVINAIMAQKEIKPLDTTGTVMRYAEEMARHEQEMRETVQDEVVEAAEEAKKPMPDFDFSKYADGAEEDIKDRKAPQDGVVHDKPAAAEEIPTEPEQKEAEQVVNFQTAPVNKESQSPSEQKEEENKTQSLEGSDPKGSVSESSERSSSETVSEPVVGRKKSIRKVKEECQREADEFNEEIVRTAEKAGRQIEEAVRHG